MKDDEKLDLSALREGDDAARFERMVAHITRRALAARRPPSLWEQLMAWSWPALATAALVPLLVWSVRLAQPPPPPAAPVAGAPMEQSELILAWALQQRAPTPEDLLMNFPSGSPPHVP